MRFICLIVYWAIACWPAQAQNAPFPQLDTGGHTATVHGVAFTPDGKKLVSAGDDKVIRVWDLTNGRTIGTMRGDSSVGSPGRIFALSLSADGKWLAVGGDLRSVVGSNPKESTVQIIRLYDVESGKLVAGLKGHDSVVRALAFSSDGTQLISGSSDGTAIIWDIGLQPDGRSPKPVVRHRLERHTSQINAVAFSPDGERVVTAHFDGDVRLWRASDGGLITVMPGHHARVMSIAFAQSGIVASGDSAGVIRLWNGRDGDFLRVLPQQKFGFATVTFSPDSKMLLATCGYNGCTKVPAYVFDVESGAPVATYAGHDNDIYGSAFSPDGAWVATGGGTDNSIHIWQPTTSERRLGGDGRRLQLGGQGRVVWAARISADGRRIGWGFADACPDVSHCPNEQILISQALILPLSDATLGGPKALSEPDANTFRKALTSLDGWTLRHRPSADNAYDDTTLDIMEDGQPPVSITRGPSNGMGHHAYTFDPSGETVISAGSDGVITAYDRSGHPLGDFSGHEGNVFSVVSSADGRFLVTCSADATVRLWNLKTRRLVVSLYQSLDGDWVMWTPQGYFASSGPGSEMIGWQINHGPDRGADYVTAGQLRKRLNRPDIVVRAIQLASAEEAVKEASGTKFELTDLMASPVPRFQIVSPPQETTVRGGAVQIKIALEAVQDPVRMIRIQVNGLAVSEHQPEKSGGFAAGSLTYSVPLASGTNIVRVIAINDTGETSAELKLLHQGGGVLDVKDRLYVIAIGVDKYPKLGLNCTDAAGGPKSCDLRLAGVDAEAFAKNAVERVGPLHKNGVVTRVLVNGRDEADTPTVAHVLDALQMLSQSGPNDTVMMFISGHGINDRSNYRFLPTDAEFKDGVPRASSVVPWVNIQESIESARGRRILFLDTCHSGNSYNQRLSNDIYSANIIAYSAARWDQAAWESTRLGHGLFTAAVVEGLTGAAKTNIGIVGTDSLREFVAKRVANLAREMRKEQDPQYFHGRDAIDSVLTLVK